MSVEHIKQGLRRGAEHAQQARREFQAGGNVAASFGATTQGMARDIKTSRPASLLRSSGSLTGVTTSVQLWAGAGLEAIKRAIGEEPTNPHAAQALAAAERGSQLADENVARATIIAENAEAIAGHARAVHDRLPEMAVRLERMGAILGELAARNGIPAQIAMMATEYSKEL